MQEVPFESITVPHEGKHRTAFVVSCNKCDNKLTIIRPTHLRQLKRVQVENKLCAEALDKAGWAYKNGFRRCTCPDHILDPIAKEHVADVQEEKEQVGSITAELAKAEQAKVETFRQPNLIQRRQILEALEMVYDVDKGCYTKGNSDSTVADKLKCPRKWVTDLRELLFGLNEKSEDFAETLAAVKAIQKQVIATEDRFMAEFAKLDTLKSELSKLVENLTK